MRRATLPGSICAPMKTSTLRRKSVMTARPSRLSRNRAITLPSRGAGARRLRPIALATLCREARLGQVELARCGGDSVLQRRHCCREEVVEVREDDRGLVEQ